MDELTKLRDSNEDHILVRSYSSKIIFRFANYISLNFLQKTDIKGENSMLFTSYFYNRHLL